MARKPKDLEAPPPVTVDDVVEWLVDAAQSTGRVKRELRARGVTASASKHLLSEARKAIKELAKPVPVELQRARLQSLIAKAAAAGDSRNYRALTQELRQLDRAKLRLPKDLTPESQRAYVSDVMRLRLAGSLTAAEAREALAPLGTLAQVSYAEAAATRSATPDEVEEKPTTPEELARWTVTRGQA